MRRGLAVLTMLGLFGGAEARWAASLREAFCGVARATEGEPPAAVDVEPSDDTKTDASGDTKTDASGDTNTDASGDTKTDAPDDTRIDPAGGNDPDTLGFALELGGGSAIKWGASDETGNAFGGLALLAVSDFEVGLGAAVVLPDSRLQADFAMIWAEGRFHLLGARRAGGLNISPYALLGVGVTLGDEFTRLPTGFVPARWSSDTNIAVMLGAGARLGRPLGLYLSAEARAVNHTHLALQLLIGYRFR